MRAVILYGEGPVFSAGVDFGDARGRRAAARRRDPLRSHVGDMQAALSRLETLEKPVIAALHRYVPGLGLELALACDFRIATADCELGLPEVKLGLVPDVGGTTRLVRTVGYARAKELIMTGRMIRADEALAIGLVHQVVPAGEHLRAAARARARRSRPTRRSPSGSRSASSTSAASVDKQTFLQMELLAQSLLVRTDDAREGARALAERRPAALHRALRRAWPAGTSSPPRSRVGGTRS